jgi:hypothetical protein
VLVEVGLALESEADLVVSEVCCLVQLERARPVANITLKRIQTHGVLGIGFVVSI